MKGVKGKLSGTCFRETTLLHKQDSAKTILPKIGAYIRTEQYEQNSTATQL